MRGLQRRRAAGQRQSICGEDCIAGAGDVNGLVASTNRYARHAIACFKQLNTVAAAGYEKRAQRDRREGRSAAAGQLVEVRANGSVMQSFEFRFIWSRRHDSGLGIRGEMVASVQRHNQSASTFHRGLANQGRTGDPKTIVGNRECVGGTNLGRQELLYFLACGFGEGSLRLTIHAENLLTYGVRPAGEEARLGWCGPAFHANNSGNVRAFATEIFEQRVTLGVLANCGDGKYSRS